MSKKEKRRLTLIDRADAGSQSVANLLQAKKRLPKNSEHVNPHFKFFYSRKTKRILLVNNNPCMEKSFVLLSAVEAAVLREIQKETSGINKSFTITDLVIRKTLRFCDLEAIRSILKVLMKKRILDKEELESIGLKISVFKLR